MAITLLVIGGYSISGYWWLFYWWLLIIIVLWLLVVISQMAIGGY